MTMNCGHCGMLINVKGWHPLYRTCDAYVCSPACSRARMQVITRLDPNLTQPMQWAHTSTLNPPKTFERKSSFVGLSNLDLSPDIDIHMPIIHESDDPENQQPRYMPVAPQHNNRNTLFDRIVNTASTVCVTVFALGVLILAT